MEENMMNEIEVEEAAMVEEAPKKKGHNPLLIGAVGVIAGALAHKYIIAPWKDKRKAKKALKSQEAKTERIEAECSDVEETNE